MGNDFQAKSLHKICNVQYGTVLENEVEENLMRTARDVISNPAYSKGMSLADYPKFSSLKTVLQKKNH